jgi:hypothetical protein
VPHVALPDRDAVGEPGLLDVAGTRHAPYSSQNHTVFPVDRVYRSRSVGLSGEGIPILISRNTLYRLVRLKN